MKRTEWVTVFCACPVDYDSRALYEAVRIVNLARRKMRISAFLKNSRRGIKIEMLAPIPRTVADALEAIP